MRQLWLAACIAALAIAPACTTYQTEAVEPTVSYSYADEDEYEEAAERADLYCEENYDKDAVLLDRDEEGETNEATFRCE